jgi:hypothetical protein
MRGFSTERRSTMSCWRSRAFCTISCGFVLAVSTVVWTAAVANEDTGPVRFFIILPTTRPQPTSQSWAVATMLPTMVSTSFVVEGDRGLVCVG